MYILILFIIRGITRKIDAFINESENFIYGEN